MPDNFCKKIGCELANFEGRNCEPAKCRIYQLAKEGENICVPCGGLDGVHKGWCKNAPAAK